MRRETLGRDAVLLDELGATAIEIQSRNEDDGATALLLDLGGRLNKSEARVTHRYVMRAGAAAELVAALVVAARASGDGDFLEEFDRALVREQERLR